VRIIAIPVTGGEANQKVACLIEIFLEEAKAAERVYPKRAEWLRRFAQNIKVIATPEVELPQP
jgi:hypothetical protein